MLRKRLTDILRNGDRDSIRQAWDGTEAADEFAPLPPGEYIAHIVAGELFTSRQNNTPGYRFDFKIIEGEHVGRRLWHDLWLTPAALPMTKRDLAKLGITALEQLEQPVPPGIRCAVKVTLRRDDDGTERNRVRSFTVLGINKPPVDAFAPPPNGMPATVGPADDDTAIISDAAEVDGELPPGAAGFDPAQLPTIPPPPNTNELFSTGTVTDSQAWARR